MQNVLVSLLIYYTLLQIALSMTISLGINLSTSFLTVLLKVAGYVLKDYGFNAFAWGHFGTVIAAEVISSWNPNLKHEQMPYVPKRLRQRTGLIILQKSVPIRALMGVVKRATAGCQATSLTKIVPTWLKEAIKCKKRHQKSPIYYRALRPRRPRRLPKTIKDAYLAHKEANQDYFDDISSRRSARIARSQDIKRKIARQLPGSSAIPSYDNWRAQLLESRRATRSKVKKPRQTSRPSTALRSICKYRRKRVAKLPWHEFTCMVARKHTAKRSEADRAIFDTDSFLIAIDSACSYCITNDRKHLTDVRKINVSIKGIGGQRIKSSLKGTAVWTYTDDEGVPYEHRIPNTHLDENSPYCLLSPQHIAQAAQDHSPTPCGTYGIIHDTAAELYWDQRSRKRTVPLDPATNIPLMRSAPGFTKFHAFNTQIDKIEGRVTVPAVAITDDEASDGDTASVVSDDATVAAGNPDRSIPERLHPDLPDEIFIPLENVGAEMELPPEDEDVQGLTPQAELLAWHYRLGHAPFGKILKMAERGELPAYLSTCRVPKCAACMFAKATRRPWRTKALPNENKIPPVLAPGNVVSVDQLMTDTPGLIAQMKGFLTRKRYTACTVFVDHFSGFTFVQNQQTTSGEETIEAKRAFEREAARYGVVIKHYHADNGIFTSALFMSEVYAKGQSITFCAVNAHHQNGRAEKKIRDLQDNARAMLIHAQQRWPSAVTVNLWPYAVRNAADVSNFAPNLTSGISPMELFAQTDVPPKIKHAHTFASPVYVLDAHLQTAGHRLKKWERKSRIGIYLGSSPRHSRKVSLVLSLKTGHVSPQFHVKHDDLFETLRTSAGNILPESNWQKETGFIVPPGKPGHDKNSAEIISVIPSAETLQWTEANNTEIVREENSPGDSTVDDAANTGTHAGRVDEIGTGTSTSVRSERGDLSPENTANPVHFITRSGRVSKPTSRLTESRQQQQELTSLYVSWDVFHDGGYDVEEELDDPIAFVASNNKDVMYLDDAMKEPDSDQFKAAMDEEIRAHTENGHWKIRKRLDVPVGTKILPSVWAMRRKRRISTNLPYKYKARLNLHGGKQEYGVNYWETYAPVIAWTTIRLFLILTIMNGWASRQIDFVLAYPQADIETTMFMEIPRGYKFKGSRLTHCLELVKNLYGQKQAGRVWNQYLHDGLIARGFRQSTVDMSLYFRGKVALLIYTDDGILIGPTPSDIDDVIKLLKGKAGKKSEFKAFNMTDEGDLCDYLGVKVDHLPNGTIKLSQPHLIQQILEDLGFNEKTTTKNTPAPSTQKIGRDLHGSPMKDAWSYRSVIGKLNFLEKSTRPEIAYAVHQCARFASDPKELHAAAVKRIGKYLLGTKDKGIILNPKEHSFDCFVDADFVGNWDRVYAAVDPSTAKSRTGYIIMYAGCPIAWASKLQQEVALSTTEAEYNALSTSLRDVIHLMQLVEEAKEMGWETFVGTPDVHCKAFEDNSGTVEWARLPKMRPRTKHMCTRLHHFRDHVRKGKISIHKIDTKLQLADMLTKPQPEALFVFQRNEVMQWNIEHCSQADLLLLLKPLRACDIPEPDDNDNVVPNDQVIGQKAIKTPKANKEANISGQRSLREVQRKGNKNSANSQRMTARRK